MSMDTTSATLSTGTSEIEHGIGATKHAIRYPILNGENYLHWKLRMEYNLRSRKLWGVVSGEKQRPTEEEEARKWDELDEEARQVIVMTVNDNQNSYLFDETSAKGMWDRLKEAYQEVSVSNRLRLKSAFNTYRKDPAHTISQHVSKVKELVQQLKAVGVTVAKEDVILILLDSLPEEYRIVKTSLKSQRDLTVEQVCARLREEEHDLGLEPKAEEEKALMLDGKSGKGILKCYKCGRPGHTKRFCRSQKRTSSNPSESKGKEGKERGGTPHLSKVQCYRCNQFGHLKRDCPSENSVNALVATMPNNEQTFVGLAAGTDSPWIVDSGATHHMCNERAAFKEIKELQSPKRIVLGNGQSTYATHIGSVELEMQTGTKISIGVLRNVLYAPEVTKKLFSVASCIEAGNEITFSTSEALIRNKENKLVGQAKLVDGLWTLQCPIRNGEALYVEALADLEIWHKRFWSPRRPKRGKGPNNGDWHGRYQSSEV